MLKRFVIVSLALVTISSLTTLSFAGGDTWTKKADMPRQRWGPNATAVNGKIYVIAGGFQGVTVTNGTLYEYDPATDEWETKTDIPTPRSRHAACAVNGKIYVIGGTPQNVGDDVLASVEECAPATDTWATKANIPMPRHSLTASVVNGKIYAIGGSRGSMAFNRAISVPKVEVYDPATDTWEKRADMPGDPALAASAGAIDGKIYLVKVSETDEYDPATDTWKPSREPMLTPRIIARGVVVNDRFCVITGYRYMDEGKVHADPKRRIWHRCFRWENICIWGYNTLGMEYYSTVEEYTPEGWPFGPGQSVLSPQDKMITMWGNVKSCR